ncbi:DUF6011 domain-containing protein [Rhodococcus sp. LW-XY12]|uniref:DUF6011 domain-containing protein n=1 Tax=Rhodococcus sp. LW-XY12 TaxID=2856851 RepID=UPI001C561583|nr:DUF6011 domain-containing protein [Rhodococcus sp. LW-XY12]
MRHLNDNQNEPVGPDPLASLDAEVRRHGARVATKCRVCGRWLVSPKSRAAHEGPTCRTKDGGAA